MVFKQNFVAVVKVNGKIMRETEGVVKVPFESEYSVLLKNKESRKAVVSIEIDGQDVLSGKQLIIGPNRDSELFGFLDGQTVRNRFKFIQKTKEIVDYRGDRVDDGIIRVAFRFEKEVINQPVIHYDYHYVPYYNYYPYDHHDHHHWDYYWPPQPSPWPWREVGFKECGTAGNLENSMFTANLGNMSGTLNASASTSTSCNAIDGSAPQEDEGITVKGSQTYQNFTVGTTRELEDQEYVIILTLKGTNVSGSLVESPVTIQTKLVCGICGRSFSSGAKFCSNCGAFLE